MTLITHSDETTAASTPSHPNRRGLRWDLFECDGRGTLEIQRVDLVDLDGVKPFATDRETAGFVLCMAQWTDNPDRALRDECRVALAQLVASWSASASGQNNLTRRNEMTDRQSQATPRFSRRQVTALRNLAARRLKKRRQRPPLLSPDPPPRYDELWEEAMARLKPSIEPKMDPMRF